MANKKSADKKECPPIKIKYIFGDDYNPKYANGAYGGVTPLGEIVANFYFERHPLPNAEILSHESHSYDPEDLPNSAVRFVDTGVILSPENARTLAEWLLNQVKIAAELRESMVGSESSDEN